MDLITTEVYSYGGWPKYSLDYGLGHSELPGTKPPKGGLSPSEGDDGSAGRSAKQTLHFQPPI